MQTPTSPMATALAMRSPTSLTSITRQPIVLIEVYPNDYLPTSGFDPDDAIARWCQDTEITWLGNSYRRVVTSRGDASRFISGQFNSSDLTLANNDLYASTWILANDPEGYRVIYRYIDRAASTTLADSIVFCINDMKR